MQTLEEFKEIYLKKYQPLLKELESKRLTILVLIAICVICAFLLWFFWYSKVALMVVLSVAGGTVSGIYAYIGLKEYRVSYKLKIVRPIIEGINADYKYFYDSHISPKHFLKSGLYKTAPDRFRGDDLVQGKHGDISFEMSEMILSRSVNDSTEEVFKGLFFVFNLPISFEEETYVLPNRSDSPIGYQSQKSN